MTDYEDLYNLDTEVEEINRGPGNWKKRSTHSHHTQTAPSDPKTELKELFVDEEYRRDTDLTPKCLTFKKYIQRWFGDEIFSFQDIKEYARSTGITEFAASQWLNMMFKYGILRKFYIGKWVSNEGGNYWGVHYQLKDERSFD